MPRKDATGQHATAQKWKRRFGWITGSILVLITCLAIRTHWGPDNASAQVQQASAVRPVAQGRQPLPAKPNAKELQIMANINGQAIRRNELANACVLRFGKDVLESLVNKHLISSHCRKHNIVISRQDIDDEIARTARKFRMDVNQYLAMLGSERNITKEEYARDIIWPTLALRRLAADQLTVTEQEIEQAYLSEYGPSVQTRMIAVDKLSLAQQIRTKLLVNPEEFPRLSRQHSIDINSASVGGLVPPIRRFVGEKVIEEEVFGLEPGQISKVVRVGDQYLVFKCEKKLPAHDIDKKLVREILTDKIRDNKLRKVGHEVFRRVQKEAVVVNVYNDPQRRKQMPGVAATINGHPIPMIELAEECLARHGEAVLEGEINRILLDQALKHNGLKVTTEDINAEVAHAATLAGVVDQANKPDIDRWIQGVTDHQGVSRETYFRDSVWPSAALKKLVREKPHEQLKVTEEDLQKGFEANYGQRVRCRAIVMTNLRRCQEVWNKARQDQTVEYFAKLAEEYSVEPTSKALGGEVPPIKRHGGQPILEKEAFALKPGDLSGVIQVGDKFVLLFCEGYTKPVKVNLAEVRSLIAGDIYEKKLRIAMAKRYESLHQSAQIDNFLAGTTQSGAKPKQQAATRPAARLR